MATTKTTKETTHNKMGKQRTETIPLEINKPREHSFRIRDSLKERRRAREIKKRIMLKGKKIALSAQDFCFLVGAMVAAINDKDVGLNHVSTDSLGWFNSLIPLGVSIDEAFVEDMLYAASMLDEGGSYKRLTGTTFEELLKRVVRGSKIFDRETHTIKEANKEIRHE